MISTLNDLPVATREKVSALLQQRVADAIDLRLQLKHAHWNVRGMHFAALHKLFDEVQATIDELTDDLAERSVQLGLVVEGTARTTAKRSSLAEYPTTIVLDREHVAAVAKALAAFGKAIRADIDEASKLGDADTADLFTGASRDIDKALWMVEAHAFG